MSGEVAISVDGLGKRYRLGHAVERPRNFREALKRIPLAPFRYLKYRLTPPSESETLWALREVSFDVRFGEALGVIGPNGAGKSTLLKILSRITDPTEGSARVRGRVNSLLEVGTGFHQELSGRDNIFMNAALHGMRRREIMAKFDEIVEFSGVSKFIDTPVKRYSSGMYTRLAFAVAAHLEPEVLIVDEVLAVGDVDFQKKCLGKMSEVTGQGRAVLFVSHNMNAVQRLCPNCLLFRQGRVVARGKSADVIPRYLMEGGGLAALRSHVEFPEQRDTPGQVLRARLTREDGRTVDGPLEVDMPFAIEAEVIIRETVFGGYACMFLRNEEGMVVLFSDNRDAPASLSLIQPGRTTFRIRIPAPLLTPGRYTVTLNLCQEPEGNYEGHPDLLAFEIKDSRGLRARRDGCIYQPFVWDSRPV